VTESNTSDDIGETSPRVSRGGMESTAGDARDKGRVQMTRWQYFLAQFGSPKKRKNACALLLDLEALPEGDWKYVQELAWRVGRVGKKSEWGQRSRKTGAFTAAHTFQWVEGSKSLRIQVIPYVSRNDAQLAVPWLLQDMDFRSNSKFSLVHREDAEGVKIPDVENVHSIEIQGTTEKGPVSSRTVIGNVEEVVVLISGSGSGSGWSPEEISSVASRQANRIRSVSIGRSFSPSLPLEALRKNTRTRITIVLLLLAFFVGGAIYIHSEPGQDNPAFNGLTSASSPYLCPVNPPARIQFSSQRPPMEIKLIWSDTSNTAASIFIQKYKGCFTYMIAELHGTNINGVPRNSKIELGEFWADASKRQIDGVTQDFKSSRLFTKVSNAQTLRCPRHSADPFGCVLYLYKQWSYAA